MVMKVNEFYSVKLKKKIMIPKVDIRQVVKKGRKFAVGKYKVKGIEFEAWKILGKA